MSTPIGIKLGCTRAMLKLTIIPRARVGYDKVRSAELAIIISDLKSVSGIIVLFKTIKKYC